MRDIICPAFRALATLAHKARAALTALTPLSTAEASHRLLEETRRQRQRQRDAAERLAEAEAERDVAEPNEGPCPGDHSGCDGSLDSCYGCDEDGQLTRVGRQLKAAFDNDGDDDPTAFVDHDYVRPKLPGSKAETEGQCLTPGPYAWTICSKPTGHDGWHGYAGIFWSAYFSPATGRSLPPIPVYPASNRVNPDSSCATGEAQCCGPAAQESPAAGFEWLTPPAAGQPNHPPK